MLSSDRNVLNLAKTCKQLKHEYTSYFYGRSTLRVLAPAINTSFGTGAVQLRSALDRFVKQYITWNEPPRLEIDIGRVDMMRPREQWPTIEGPLRRLAKTSTKIDLSFDLVRNTSHVHFELHVEIRLDSPEHVAAQLEATYFSQRHRALLLDRDMPRDPDVSVFLAFESTSCGHCFQCGGFVKHHEAAGIIEIGPISQTGSSLLRISFSSCSIRSRLNRGLERDRWKALAEIEHA